MSRVHLIDDNEVIRKDLRGALEPRLPNHQIEIRDWPSAKAAADSVIDGDPEAPICGEVAICDLFDIDHYAEQFGDEPYVYAQIRSRPGTPENVKRASLDNICRFFPPLIGAGLRIVVFSYVFALLRLEGDPEGAAEVERALAEVGVGASEILEKPEREVDTDHLEPVADKVAAMIAER